MKTAIASTDGKVVNQHFGRADKFYIVDVNEDTYEFRLTEERKTVPVCQSGDHNDTDMAEAVERLSDCDSVLVSRIGIRAKNEFEKRGIQVFELPDFIENSIEKMVKYLKLEKILKGE